MNLLNVQHVLKSETVYEIVKLGLTAQKIADRWVLGWKRRVIAMEKDGTLLPRLKEQALHEAEVLSEARQGGTLNHLADREIAELYDLSTGP